MYGQFSLNTFIYMCIYMLVDLCYIILSILIQVDALMSTDSSNLFDIMHKAGDGFVRDSIEQATCSRCSNTP